eukprot:10305727-Prorocentrum_lima.AAC.1
MLDMASDGSNRVVGVLRKPRLPDHNQYVGLAPEPLQSSHINTWLPSPSPSTAVVAAHCQPRTHY